MVKRDPKYYNKFFSSRPPPPPYTASLATAGEGGPRVAAELTSSRVRVPENGIGCEIKGKLKNAQPKQYSRAYKHTYIVRGKTESSSILFLLSLSLSSSGADGPETFSPIDTRPTVVVLRPQTTHVVGDLYATFTPPDQSVLRSRGRRASERG